MRIGVDIGGTFTDVVVLTDEGLLRSFKVPSTPSAFAQGVLDGVALAAEELGINERRLLEDSSDFNPGTTVTTNVVLTRTGERVGLITTRGFRDTYALAREYRGHEQDPAKSSHPEPLAALEDIEEVTERVDYAGRDVVPLDKDEVVAAAERLVAKGIKAIAICFLWSFRNSEHEEQARQIVLELAPDAYVSASSTAAPVVGEYERTSTTVINAYGGPILERYTRSLDAQLREKGLPKSLLIMKSDGGPASIETAVSRAAQTVYSGPTAGVIASMSLGQSLNEPNLITFDMGGTSTDVALVVNGQCQTTTLQFLQRQAFAAPMIDVTSVGAGGGSIAAIDAGGSLKVGPESSGADPGPACYGRGGTLPAVTDANVILVLISPDAFLGGRSTLVRDRAEAALQPVADGLGLSLEATAHGAFRVANAVMADAIRLRTVYAGFDPRDFVLVSFGGAGGLHCATVARELGMKKIIVPRMASVFSAVGLLAADLTYSYAKSASISFGPGGSIDESDLRLMNSTLGDLAEQGASELDLQEIPDEKRRFAFSVEMSYKGQILDMDTPLPKGPPFTAANVAALTRLFDERYANLYGPGAAVPDAGYRVSLYKVIGTGAIGVRDLAPDLVSTEADPRPRAHRRALVDANSAEFADVPVYSGELLPAGFGAEGPAILEFVDTNVLVPSGFGFSIDNGGNVLMESR